jgi:hypothetical protein
MQRVWAAEHEAEVVVAARQRLRNQVQALETQANRTCFRKQIDIRTFAYHVG